MDMIIVADAAEEAGTVFGRLLFLALGIVLIVVGNRRRAESRRQPGAPSRGTAMFVIGIVLLVLVVLGTLASMSTSP